MFRIAVTLSVSTAVLFAGLTAPATGQPPVASGPNGSAEANRSAEKPPTKKAEKPDLKKVFDDETKRFSKRSAEFDPVKLELEKNRQQAKKGWSKQDVTFMVVFAAGIAVLVWLLVKYGKNCIETNYPNCTPAVDEGCYCERYEEDNKNRGMRTP